jgi:nucleoside 2-deoxyribosyltransferase
MIDISSTVYISIPMREAEKSYIIEEALQKIGFKVNNPCRIPGIETADKELLASHFSGECYRMMDESGLMVLLLDYFGNDCAAEIGYMYGSQKYIYGVSVDKAKSDAFLSNHEVKEDAMKTLTLIKKFDSLDELTTFLKEQYNQK